MGALTVEASQVLRHRLRANGLAERLPAGSFAPAAFAGLQDSAPRAALTALAARVEDVGPAAWEDPGLVQTWAPRGAVFIVPGSDLAVFARGFVPRDPELRRTLEELAVRARDSIGAGRRDQGRQETDRLGPLPAVVAERMRRGPTWRLVCALAGVQIRWDVRSTRLLASPPVEMDEEEARLELARRFLRSLGPAGPARFTRWAAVGDTDARATFAALAPELVEVLCSGRSGFVLDEDAERLAHAQPVSAVRFVAFGDPVLQPGEDTLVADPARRKAALPAWACTGLVLLDGGVVASWGRKQRRVTILPLTPAAHRRRPEIEAEARGLPVAGDVNVHFHPS